MRSLQMLCMTVLLGIGLGACGSGKSASSVSKPAAAVSPPTTATSVASAAPVQDYAKADRDRDNDIGVTADDTNNDEALNYGHAASPAEKRAVTTLIKRYYAAALASDGAKACSMIYVTIAESVPEDQGEGSAGPSYQSQGKTCPQVMALMFMHFHSQLAGQVPILKVSRVRVRKHRGLAVLSFGAMPERQIALLLERGIWKLAWLLDDALR